MWPKGKVTAGAGSSLLVPVMSELDAWATALLSVLWYKYYGIVVLRRHCSWSGGAGSSLLTSATSQSLVSGTDGTQIHFPLRRLPFILIKPPSTPQPHGAGILYHHCNTTNMSKRNDILLEFSSEALCSYGVYIHIWQINIKSIRYGIAEH